MRIIFLDFDGVLNSRRFFATRPPDGADDEALDPTAVARVNRIVERTGARVVVSSSWRLSDPVERIVAILRQHGFAGEVVGTTPVLAGSRGREIRAWLRASRGITSYVILDDATDMDGLGRHVLTRAEDGLLDEHVELACRLLSRRRLWPFG
jgi:hypothetical protein